MYTQLNPTSWLSRRRFGKQGPVVEKVIDPLQTKIKNSLTSTRTNDRDTIHTPHWTTVWLYWVTEAERESTRPVQHGACMEVNSAYSLLVNMAAHPGAAVVTGDQIVGALNPESWHRLNEIPAMLWYYPAVIIISTSLSNAVPIPHSTIIECTFNIYHAYHCYTCKIIDTWLA